MNITEIAAVALINPVPVIVSKSNGLAEVSLRAVMVMLPDVAAVMVMVAEPDLVVLAVLVAVMVTGLVAGMVLGAV
jgi:hypothetical protein